jgi:hypothetical protein
MTHREIATASLMMESHFQNPGASPFERAAAIVVCLPIPSLPGLYDQIQPRPGASETLFRRSAAPYPIPGAQAARDYFEQDCKPNSIPI